MLARQGNAVILALVGSQRRAPECAGSPSVAWRLGFAGPTTSRVCWERDYAGGWTVGRFGDCDAEGEQ